VKQRRRLPVADGAEGLSLQHVSALERERPRQPGLRQERWRLSFEKLGASALLGHLDFMRELGRVIRRAGLRPVYSQGFRPKPRFSFGPALALGVASLDEKIDVDLIDPPADAALLLQQLNDVTGSGLRFVAAERFSPATVPLGNAVQGARYLLLFAEAVLPRAELEAKVAAFLQLEKRLVRRSVKGIGRLIDVRARIQSLRVGNAADQARAAAAGVTGRLICVVAEVDMGPAGSVKPSEIVEAVLGDASLPHQAIRDALLLGTATPAKPPWTEQVHEPEPPKHGAAASALS
jgi:radical SAM-linked protein